MARQALRSQHRSALLSALIAGVSLLADGRGSACAGGGPPVALQPLPVWGWPMVPPPPFDPLLYPGYWLSPCYPFASCAAQFHHEMLQRRSARLRELRRDETQPQPPLGIDTWGGSLASRQARAAAPRTEEAQVQPEYAASGQVRPEYGTTGEFLPEFLEGSVRPAGR
jgi:hypothetical protein